MGDKQTRRIRVKVRAFLMDRYPMTQDIFEAVMNSNPSRFHGKRRPVENITWLDAVIFCDALSKASGLDSVYEIKGKNTKADFGKNGYRLPTESEWEYACLRKNADYADSDAVAWFNKHETSTVGEREKNASGLNDMLGNVWEWCQDWYQPHHQTRPLVDFQGPDDGDERVIRGGSWRSPPNRINPEARSRKHPLTRDETIGFRVVRREIT